MVFTPRFITASSLVRYNKLFDLSLAMSDNKSGMNIQRTAIVTMLALAVLVSPLVRAEGQPLDAAALDVIRTNCVNTQVNLQRLQQSEKPTRINRGYLYDTLLKLMANFNSRVAQNKIDSPELLSITSEYERQLKSFTATYTKYDESLSTLTSMDCRANPARFNDTLAQTRQLRSSLAQTIDALDTLLSRYQTNVDAVRKVVEADL